MNVFQNPKLAQEYDDYYQSGFGKQVDQIEKRIISELLTDVPRQKLLDLGCGTGHWTGFFIDEGFSVTGMDLSPAMLKIAKEKNLNAEFILADTKRIPFKDESFDAIASIAMLEFVEDQDSAVREIFRVLKKGGWFILGGLNEDSVLGKNKENDEVFRTARFWDVREIPLKFNEFDLLQMKQGVYIDPDFSIVEHPEGDIEPAFIAALFQKK